jgi:hypothetical protein
MGSIPRRNPFAREWRVKDLMSQTFKFREEGEKIRLFGEFIRQRCCANQIEQVKRTFDQRTTRRHMPNGPGKSNPFPDRPDDIKMIDNQPEKGPTF